MREWVRIFELLLSCRCSVFILSSLAARSNPCSIFRKDAKKVSKLEAQIPYHEGRGNKEEVEKIKEQIAGIWQKAKEDAE